MPLTPPSTTIRSLARTLRLAPSTVSDALRGTGRVGAATARRVRATASALGYRVNPLTATVLGELRRTRGPRLRGTLAVLDLHETVHWPHGPFPRELVAGVSARAAEMGFSIAEFIVGGPGLSPARLNSVLSSRGIHGIIVLPSWRRPDLTGLDWTRCAGIHVDFGSTLPALHSVSPDHYGSMLALLTRLAARGYRRPGLVLEQGRDERVEHLQTAAFRAFLAQHGGLEPASLLITPGVPERARDFLPWFRRHRPDVVLSHLPETEEWLAAAPPPARARPSLGDRSGFVLLNAIERRTRCAALDLQPRLLGARAAELLVGQLMRNQLGAPAWASRTTVQARWIEGDTVRPPVPAAVLDMAPSGA